MPRTGLYVALDVHYQDDGKMIDLPNECELAYIRALVLAKRNRSSGFIEHGQQALICAGWPRDDWTLIVGTLVDRGLFLECEDGWLIAGWAHHNSDGDPTAAERKRRQRARATHTPVETVETVETVDTVNVTAVTVATPDSHDGHAMSRVTVTPVTVPCDVTPGRHYKRSDQINRDQDQNTRAKFDEFWNSWPRKVGKPNALRAFSKATKRAGPNDIIEGAISWAAHWRDTHTNPQYIPHPATWLNRDGWNDQPPIPHPSEPKGFATIRRALNLIDSSTG